MLKTVLPNIFFIISLVVPGIYGAENQKAQPGQPCTQYGQDIAFPGNCTKYLHCVGGAGPSQVRTSELKLEEMECSPDHYFHSPEKGCLQGPCPGCHLALGHNVECTKEGDIVAHPRNCSMYSECIRNEARCELGEWGRKDRSCPHNRFFDPAEKVCIETAECPQVCPVKKNYETKCTKEMDTVDDKNCVKKTICVKAETCAAEGFKPYWHLLCPCVCREDKQVFGFRSSCTKYVSCKLDGNAIYSFESNECPTGEYFDLAKGHCKRGICTGCPTQDHAEFRQQCTELNQKIPIEDKCYVCRKAPPRCEVNEWVLAEMSKSECFGDCPEADRTNTCTSEGQTIESGECPEGMVQTCIKVEKCPEQNSKAYYTVECLELLPGPNNDMSANYHETFIVDT